MSGRVSRLWRKLGATAPLFRVWNQGVVDHDDHTIKSITINRGSSGPEGGVHPPTMTVEFTTLGYVNDERRIYVDLTPYGRYRMNQLTGASQDAILRRFYGRIGKQTVNDEALPNGTIRQQTTYEAAGWEAQLPNFARKWNFTRDKRVSDLIMTLARPVAGYTEFPSWFAPAPASQYGNVREDRTETETYSEAIGKWTTDIGLYVQTQRTGSLHILPHEYRWNRALSLMPYRVPLTRSQAVSPATWEQPSENIPRVHEARWYSGDGAQVLRWGPPDYTDDYPVVDHDMRHVVWWNNDSQPRSAVQAFYRQNIVTHYSVPAVTFDLLMLATSPHKSHRDQAKQLLELEVGEAVYLSGDWFGQVSGVYFAVGVDESISPDGWDITLNLSPAHEVVGVFSPDVPAQTFESMRHPWNDAAGTWNR